MSQIRKKKWYRAGLFLLTAAAVYFSFRFLLPIVLPFGIGWILAVKMRKATVWAKKRLQIPEPVSAGILLTLLTSALGAALVFLGGKLTEQLGLLYRRFPRIFEDMDKVVYSCCCKAEAFLRLPDGMVFETVQKLRLTMADQVQDRLLPAVAGASVPMVKGAAKAVAMLAVSTMACILAVSDMDELKRRQQASLFGTEVTALCRRLSLAGGAWLKSQALILVLVSAVCIAGLWILKNPYPTALGLGIGIVDMLPILGTGTVLFPWAAVCLFRKKYIMAGGLVLIYAICYFLREFMEARFMGNQIGITGFETLLSIYVGLSLFGLWGMLLGPAGYLIIREVLSLY